MAQKFAERIGFVDQLISSPAERAFTTSKIFAVAMNVEISNMNLVRDIYEADITALLRVLNAIDKSVKSAAMFGHNPGLSNLCYYLTNQAVHMPTCGIAELHFELNDWSMLSKETCILFNFDYPKRYR
jgi:phosphohistidine phosphatase